MISFLRLINPIYRLGNSRYSMIPALLFSILTIISFEFYYLVIRGDSQAVSGHVIFIFLALIIYFSLRDGIIGGVTASFVAIFYFTYLIITKLETVDQQIDGTEMTLILMCLYLFVSIVIGWLRQTIDKLIEREANEKIRLQSIIEQLPVGVIITDENGIIVNGNSRVNRLLGKPVKKGLVIDKDKLVEGYSNGKLLLPNQWPLVKALHNHKQFTDDIVIYQDDSQKKYIQVSSSVIRNKNNKIIAAASIFNDITEQKELEERKDDFVNMASHELKTPITSNKIYLDLLNNYINKDEKEKAIKTVASIKYQTERLQELVSDLLDVSRLQTGKLSLRKEAFFIKDIITETMAHLQETVQQELLFSTSKNPKVVADKFRLYQVLNNLITNAAKYSPKDSQILINLLQDKDTITVSVQDFGIGISKLQQKKIFDRLYQVTDAKEKTFPGLGMGLYISKEIIRKHQGKIWVESKKNQGSTFYFTLPRKR